MQLMTATGFCAFCYSFTQVPPQVMELTNLSDLYMASNQIQSVPEDIHRLQRYVESVLKNIATSSQHST